MTNILSECIRRSLVGELLLESGVLDVRGLRGKAERLLLSTVELTSELGWLILMDIEAVLMLLNVSQDVVLLHLRQLSSLKRSLGGDTKFSYKFQTHKIIVNILSAYHNDDVKIISRLMKRLFSIKVSVGKSIPNVLVSLCSVTEEN